MLLVFVFVGTAQLSLSRPAPHVSDNNALAGKYIVTLKPNVTRADQFSSHVDWVNLVHSQSIDGGRTKGVNMVWMHSFKEYQGEFDEGTISQIVKSGDVCFQFLLVRAGLEALILQVAKVAAVESVQVVETSGIISQTDATWGPGSLSHRTPYWHDYPYDSSAGGGMWAYIADTGFNAQNLQFQDRGYLGYNTYPDSEFVDSQGHGTHCAGIIAAKTYGILKKANIMLVKVFGNHYVSALPLSMPASAFSSS